jgi:hypothetical protein
MNDSRNLTGMRLKKSRGVAYSFASGALIASIAKYRGRAAAFRREETKPAGRAKKRTGHDETSEKL